MRFKILYTQTTKQLYYGTAMTTTVLEFDNVDVANEAYALLPVGSVSKEYAQVEARATKLWKETPQ